MSLSNILFNIPARHTICSKREEDPFTEYITGRADTLFCRILEATSAMDSSGPACSFEKNKVGIDCKNELPTDKAQ